MRLEADDWAGGAPLLAKRLAALPVVELSVPALPLQNPNSPDFDPEPAKAAASLLIKYQVGRAGRAGLSCRVARRSRPGSRGCICCALMQPGVQDADYTMSCCGKRGKRGSSAGERAERPS